MGVSLSLIGESQTFIHEPRRHTGETQPLTREARRLTDECSISKTRVISRSEPLGRIVCWARTGWRQDARVTGCLEPVGSTDSSRSAKATGYIHERHLPWRGSGKKRVSLFCERRVFRRPSGAHFTFRRGPVACADRLLSKVPTGQPRRDIRFADSRRFFGSAAEWSEAPAERDAAKSRDPVDFTRDVLRMRPLRSLVTKNEIRKGDGISPLAGARSR